MSTAQNILAWLFFGEFAAWCAFPWIAFFFRRLPDGGMGAAKATSWLLLAYGTWLLSTFAHVPFRAGYLWLGLFLAATSSVTLLVADKKLRSRCRKALRRYGVTVQLLFLGSFAFACVVRALQPEIFWGEKPMDFAFLNYFTRFETGVVQDPWAAGNSMSYYYLGSWLFAAWSKATTVPTSFAFNLALASVFAGAVAAGFTLCLPMVRKTRWAVIGAFTPFLVANLEGARQWFFTGRVANFDSFWATSRTLPHAIANEYPLWSMLFADLHAHYVALPFVTAFLALAVGLTQQRKRPPVWRGLASRVFVGTVLGAIFAVNGWDFLSYTLIYGALVLFVPPASLRGSRAVRGIFARLSESGLVTLVAYGVSKPFASQLRETEAGGQGFNIVDFHTPGDLWSVHGVWFVLFLVVSLASVVSRAGRSRRLHRTLQKVPVFGTPLEETTPPSSSVLFRRSIERWLPWSVALTPVLLWFAPEIKKNPFGLLALISTLAMSAIPLLRSSRIGSRQAGALFLGATGVVLFAEVYWLFDRMNSLFKLHYAAWLVYGFAVAGVAPHLATIVRSGFSTLRETHPIRVRTFAALLIALTLSAALFGTVRHVVTMTTFHRIPGPRPTLDGTAYMTGKYAEDAALAHWIAAHADVNDVVVEAHGDAYREFSRVSMHTGIPIVLGWEHHVKQRGTTPEDVETRRGDIEKIYRDFDWMKTQQILAKYRVKYVIYGSVERTRYGADGERKWAHPPDMLRPVFSVGDAAIYEAPETTPSRALAKERS